MFVDCFSVEFAAASAFAFLALSFGVVASIAALALPSSTPLLLVEECDCLGAACAIRF
jgi:hypothetical protein